MVSLLNYNDLPSLGRCSHGYQHQFQRSPGKAIEEYALAHGFIKSSDECGQISVLQIKILRY